MSGVSSKPNLKDLTRVLAQHSPLAPSHPSPTPSQPLVSPSQPSLALIQPLDSPKQTANAHAQPSNSSPTSAQVPRKSDDFIPLQLSPSPSQHPPRLPLNPVQPSSPSQSLGEGRGGKAGAGLGRFVEEVEVQHNTLLGKMALLREALAKQLGQSDEREDIQKKTFAKWINSQLSKGGHPPVTDLFYDLRDGTRLLALLEVLTAQTYKREKGRMRVHHLNNVSRALDVLDQNSVKLVNISNEHIVDGSPKLTLGLVWAIILHWQVQGVLKDVMSDLQQTNLEKTLLAWCRQTTKGYEGVDVRNFTTSWSDGLAFNALLHAHRPTLFDWSVLVRRLPYARLDHAFRLAQQHLGIERLLDPEDVNSQVPDKKSIMMYVMCLFQALPHDGSFSIDTSLQSESSLSIEGESMEASGLSLMASTPGKGRPLSTSSIGLSVYQRTLEEVLSWLLGAEDRLAAMPPIGPTTEVVKEQFHDLEELMLDLTSKQGGIGEVLGEGGRLLREGVMEEEEEEEVRVQMKLLNTRWEELRVKAMDRQSRLHEKLMSLQHEQLECLKRWLTETEDRIANMSQVGPTMDALKEQIAAHHCLQKDLEGEQANINSLSNMVVVVDESSSDSAYSNLEDELNALGERWAHICRWAESRWTTLQSLSIHWMHYEKELGEVQEWLDKKEAQLRQFESDPSTDQRHILKYASALQVLQAEMDIQHKRFERLQESSGKVLGFLPKDSPTQEQIATEIETVQDRMDCLLHIMEAQTQRMIASGIDISKVSVPVEGGGGGDSGVVSSTTTTITTQEGSTVVTKIVTTKVTETVTGSVVKRQKLEGGSREDFSVALNQLGGWMDKAEELVKAEPTESLTVEQLEDLCRQLESEMENQREEYNKVVSLGQSAISETSTIGESAQDSQREMATVTARWEALAEIIIVIKTRITYLMEKKVITTKIITHETHYSDLLKWCDEQKPADQGAADIPKRLEECENKLGEAKGEKKQLDEVQTRAEGLDSRWAEERHILLLQIQTLLTKLDALIARLEELISALQKRQAPLATTTTTTLSATAAPQAPKPPPDSLLKAMEASREWLKSLRAALGSEQPRGTLPQLQDRIGKFRDLSDRVETERGNIVHISNTCEELARAGHVDLSQDAARLSDEWEKMTQALTERVADLERGMEQQKQYNEEVSGLKSWLAEVDVFLKAEEAALGDVETLEAQLEQSNALQDDIATLQNNVDNIRTTGKSLMEGAGDDGGLKAEIGRQLEELMARWDLVTRLAREQNKSLRDALARSQKVQSDIEKLTTWLDQLESHVPSSIKTSTPEELTEAVMHITQLREDITAHSPDLTALNNVGDEMLQMDRPPTAGNSDLARVFTQLNGRWSNTVKQVDDQHKALSAVAQQYQEFCKLCEEESAWLDQLQAKLERSPREAADAEEISETLDELELFLHSHDQGRLDRMTALGEALVQEGCVTEKVKEDTAALTTRFHTLNAQANERQSGLEGSVQEAQAWEREYVGVLDFLAQCDVTLTQALTEEAPVDHGKVREELAQQASVLEKMEGQVEVYRAQGKTEAATRLSDQVTHLKKKYEEVEVRLEACHQPSAFEQRLAAAELQLSEISQRVETVTQAPSSGELSQLQGQLDQCMSVYQTLSEVKGEVEDVIASGRKVVKEGQCSDPDAVTIQLDRLKALYNELGGSATECRGSLETSLRHATRLRKDAAQLGEWLAATEKDLDQREATVPIRNIQEEVHFAQHALEELARRKPLLTTLHETLASLASSLPPATPPGTLSEMVGDVSLTWERVNTRLTNRLKNMQTEQARKEHEMEHFIMGLGEVKGWLESTETQLASLTSLHPDKRDTIIKNIWSEMETYKGRIESIRATAADLVSHGVLFHARITPELETINKRWEAVYYSLQKQESMEEEMIVSRSYVKESTQKKICATASVVSPTDNAVKAAQEVGYDEVERYLREVASLADQITTIKNKVLVVPSYLEVKEKVESVDHEVALLEPDVATVISRGDTLTLTTHMVDVPRANNIRVAVRDLRQQWAHLKSLTENLKEDSEKVEEEMGTISERVGELVSWTNDVSKRIQHANNDESQLQALESEVVSKRTDFDQLNESGALLRRYGYTRAQPSLSLLNTRWTEINAKLRQFRKGSLENKTLVGKSDETEGAQTVSDFVARVNQVREGVSAVSQQLTSRRPQGCHYVDLSGQEEQLKTVKEGLDSLKPRVDGIEGERDATMAGLTSAQTDQVRRVVDSLRQEWAQVNRAYTDQQARWVSCCETWGTLQHTLGEFTTWLDTMEARVKNAATQPLPEARATQKELEKQVTLKHRPSQSLQSMCREVTEGLGAEEAKKLQERVDSVLRRWRGLLLDLAARRERIASEEGVGSGREGGQFEGLLTWVEQAKALEEAAVNVTDEAALAAHSTMVQNHLHELPAKQELLKKLKDSQPKTVTTAQISQLEESMEKVAQSLPEYRNKTETKLGVIQTLVREVEELYRWTEEVRIRQALREPYRGQSSEEKDKDGGSSEEDRGQLDDGGKPWKVVLREKEAAFENLDSTFWVLAQDAENKGLTVSVSLKNRMSTIESRLKGLRASPPPTPPTKEAGKEAAEAQEKQEVVVGTTVTSSVTSVIKDVIKFEESVLSGEGGELRPPSPLVSPPTHPPDSSPVLILASLDKSILQIRDWLTLMEQMTRQQTVVVGDADDIRQLTEKQKNVLRELEGKKPQLDELVASADSLKDDASRTQLHQKVSKLREHWDETNSVVLARKTQLDAMYSDTHKFETKRMELEAWLNRMEVRLERMAPVARTADVLDQQIREQKGFHAEIHQYKHQVELFNQMTQRLIAIYQHDDTRRLKKVTETINLRYTSLNSSIVTRGKELHAAMNSLHSFDKALDKFLSWLSEAESGSDLLEGEVDKLPPRHPLPRAPQAHLKDLQSEIESHKDVLASLNATGQKLLGTLDNQEEAVMLQRRLHEMNQRWNTLKHKSIAIRNRLEGNSENWNSLLLSLRELIEWVIRKDTELTALGPAVGDLPSLTKYSEDLAAFRRVIDEKQPVIESNLKSGRQLIASEPPLSDTSDSEAGRDVEGDVRYRGGDEAAREVTRSVRREVSKLSDKWAALRDRAASHATQADLAHKKLGVLQKTVEDVSSRMEEAERSVEGWGPVPQDPNMADQHAHNVRKLRESLADLQRGVDDVNDQAARFSAHNVPLTPANSARLHDLNNRWKILESCVNERWRAVAGRSREVTPLTPAQLASSVAPPWERATTPSKVPYYINHEQESTHWDHPAMMELLDSLTEFNHIKFSAYRTATKLRLLQKKLALDRAKMQTATDIFDEKGLRGQNDRLIDVSDMLVVLSALYATIADENTDVDVTLAMDLCLNWLLNVYDSQRTGQMRVLSFKIGLVCLCTGHLEEKYRYMFRLIADPNRLADQRKLGLLLHDCVQVPRQLGEVAAFGGSNIEPSVRSCFTKAGKDRETIEAVHFLAWVQQEPQSLVWLAVLHRVAASENIQHQVKCNICKAYPIVGLRYRCLKCLSFDMCQRCFFDGRSGKSHKITHPMHEYCTATTAGEDVKDFTKALKNKFKSKRSLQKHTKKGYLPVQTVLEGDALESPSPSPQHNVTSQDMHSRLELYASRLAEVELRTNSNSTPDSEDEHGLIAQYCQSLSSSDAPLPVPRSPLQVMAAVDAEQKDELEQMIRALEEQNTALQAEYDRLKSQQPMESPPEDGPGGGGGGQRSEAEMIAEAKLLRQHKGRLEARMGILEEHNRQLEAQLHRLRQLLGEPGGMSSPNKSGTLQTKAVTASQLAMDSPAKVNGHSTQGGLGSGGAVSSAYDGLDQMSEYVRPPPPPMGSVAHVGNLFSRAGELGKVVGTLVATMTHEQESDWPSEGDQQRELEDQDGDEKEGRPV